MRFLFVDRILELVPGKSIRGIKHVTQDDFYLRRELPSCSIRSYPDVNIQDKEDEGYKFFLIPTLVGETLGQLAAWNVMFSNDFTRRPVAGIAASAKLMRYVYVGETILLESFIDHLDETVVQYHSIARVNDEEVFLLRGALGPLLPMQDFIDTTVVKQQFNEIYRPSTSTLSQDSMQCDQAFAIQEDEPKDVGCKKYIGPLCPAMVFDRIIACEPGKTMIAEKRITRTAAYFPDHFPLKPVLPMTVLLECKLNLASDFLRLANFGHNYQVREMHKVKMKDFIYPGDVIISYVSVKAHDDTKIVLNFRSAVNANLVCVLDLIMTVVV